MTQKGNENKEAHSAKRFKELGGKVQNSGPTTNEDLGSKKTQRDYRDHPGGFNVGLDRTENEKNRRPRLFQTHQRSKNPLTYFTNEPKTRNWNICPTTGSKYSHQFNSPQKKKKKLRRRNHQKRNVQTFKGRKTELKRRKGGEKKKTAGARGRNL